MPSKKRQESMKIMPTVITKPFNHKLVKQGSSGDKL